jgi:hypothetical protein
MSTFVFSTSGVFIFILLTFFQIFTISTGMISEFSTPRTPIIAPPDFIPITLDNAKLFWATMAAFAIGSSFTFEFFFHGWFSISFENNQSFTPGIGMSSYLCLMAWYFE